MEERGRFGSRGVRMWSVLGIVALGLLAGCISTEEIQKRTRESDGFFKQGMSYLETDQQRAFVSFQKAVQLNPDNYDPHYALGHIYFERKEYAEAEREFRACVGLVPDSGDALNYLGRSLIARSKFAEAVEVLRKATALPLYATPDYAFTNLGDALQLQGDTAGAIRSYQEAVKIDPSNVPRPLLYFQIGRLYMMQGDDTKAREALSKAKSLDPDGEVGKEAAKLMQKLR